MRFKRRVSPLRKKARRGFKGYPGATIIWYGPDDTRATKVAVGIVHGEDQPPTAMKRWYGEEGDLRNDRAIAEEIRQFLELHGVTFFNAACYFSRCRSLRLSQLASASQPPSTGRACPFTNPLNLGSAKNAMASATSVGLANRAIGTRRSMSASV